MRRLGAGLGLLAVTLLFLLVLEPLPVHATSTLVQQNSNGAQSMPPITVTVSFPSAVASGDVVVVGLGSDAPFTMSVADSLGSSFAQALVANGPPPFPYNELTAAIYTATLSSSGTDTVMATFTGSCGGCTAHVAVFIFEVAGVATTSMATGSGNVGPSPPSPAAISTNPVSFAAGAFLIGMMTCPFCVITPGAGFTLTPVVQFSVAQYSTAGVSSPTTFPATRAASNQGWVEVGLALNPPSPIPEYPLGLPILAILMIVGYGLVRRRTRN